MRTGVATAATVTRHVSASSLWAAYTRQLALRPLRTKMITSGTMFALGDTAVQFGIEGASPYMDDVDVLDVSSQRERNGWDPMRTVRLVTYGSFVFAPLAHTWLGLVDKVRYASKLKTLAVRVALDQLVWGPAIVSTFWASNGVLEGRSASQVWRKVEHAFPAAYATSVSVFLPTQILNFSVVPLQHRLAVQQSVGFAWNAWLSYSNNLNNKRLAEASAALAVAHVNEAAEQAAHPSQPVDHTEVQRAEAALAQAQARRDKIRDAEGGGATGVATRMGY